MGRRLRKVDTGSVRVRVAWDGVLCFVVNLQHVYCSVSFMDAVLIPRRLLSAADIKERCFRSPLPKAIGQADVYRKIRLAIMITDRKCRYKYKAEKQDRYKTSRK